MLTPGWAGWLAGWLCNRRHTPPGMEACHVIRACMMMGMRWLGCPGVVRGLGLEGGGDGGGGFGSV